MLFCLGLSGRITQISNILCVSASLRKKSTDEFRVNITGASRVMETWLGCPLNVIVHKSQMAEICIGGNCEQLGFVNNTEVNGGGPFAFNWPLATLGIGNIFTLATFYPARRDASPHPAVATGRGESPSSHFRCASAHDARIGCLRIHACLTVRRRSWPHAAATSLPRLRLSIVWMRAFISTSRNASCVASSGVARSGR